MVARAAGVAGIRVTRGDARTWRPGASVDVLFSNATYQWVPGHLDLFPRWVDALAADGWFAMQVPNNFGAPSHRLMREIAERVAEQLLDLMRGRRVDLASLGRRLGLAASGARMLERANLLHLMDGH